ncbi:MAG: 16S rRNA (cytidine(1402)-2'-O)-methyltransferase [Clostridiales bacterium]|nr:16S rRNA (cytidine(1402)-2'-O)-methyltransferase [Clostridiales bacterium]
MIAGKLYLVATPIGNLEDITFRAVRILNEVDIIAAEDTRHTLKLLNYLNISKPLISYYEHNMYEKGPYLINLIKEGKSVALVTDAGTPGISDPGEDLVRLAALNGITTSSIPGANAAISGLILSGLSTGRFVFEGFLPVGKKTRHLRLRAIKNEKRTIVFYEAPHKLLRTLKDLLALFGDRRIALARELTKKFEEIVRCTISEAVALYEEQKPRGEFVLVVAGEMPAEDGNTSKSSSSCDVKGDGISSGCSSGCDVEYDDDRGTKREEAEAEAKALVGSLVEKGMRKAEAIKKVSKDLGIRKNDLYRAMIKDQTDINGCLDEDHDS